MTDHPTSDPFASSPSEHVRHHWRRTHGWQVSVFLIAAALLAVGVAGQVRTNGAQRASPTALPTVGPSNENNRAVLPGRGSGFVGGGGPASPSEESPGSAAPNASAPSEAPPTPLSSLSPWATKIGGSVVGGFVVGWLARAFVKFVIGIGVLIGAALAGLSYFHVLNIDFSAAQTRYQTASAWVQDQETRLGKDLVGHLPSSTAGAAGLFVGFRRR